MKNKKAPVHEVVPWPEQGGGTPPDQIPSRPAPLPAPPLGRGAEATNMLAAIVESCDDGIASKDLHGIVTSWNAAAERIFGFTPEEIIGRPITLIIPPELQHDEKIILQKLMRGERIDHFETVRVAKDGRRINVSLTVSPVRDGSGKIIGAAKVVRDITEKKRTEEALRRVEKLAAAGQLAATIAHEINNPMQAVSNLLSLISTQAALDEHTRKLVSLAELELQRMAHISRQMLSFYRETSDPVPVDLADVLEDVVSSLAAVMRNRIKIERQFRFRGHVRVFPVEIRQVLANLLSNAAEAAGAHGRVVVRTRASHDWRSMRRGVRLVVADNGPGMPDSIRRRIFEPFFTTKKERGTGLGLWVVGGLVSKHGGRIQVRSSTHPGCSGTVFSVFLPTAGVD